MGLSPEEYSGGRQIKRGDTTLDVLDTVSGSSSQFVIARNGDTLEVVPVADLREEESDYEAVNEEDRERQRQEAEAERQDQEAKEQEEFRQWQAQRGSQPQQDTPPTPEPENRQENPTPSA